MSEPQLNHRRRSVARSPHAISQVVGDELIVLDPATENFIALNDVGARIWELLADEPHTDRLRDLIAVEYRIGEDQASADLHEFVDRLVDLGLVSCFPAP